MRLQLSTRPEVESCLERSTGILIPLGSTEQHGPSGLIGTDALVAEGIALRAASQDDAILVAPVLAYAPAQFNLAFAGTVSLRAGTFAHMRETLNHLPCTCLKRFGLREVNHLPSTPEP